MSRIEPREQGDKQKYYLCATKPPSGKHTHSLDWGVVLWFEELALNHKVLGSITATYKLFPREPAILIMYLFKPKCAAVGVFLNASSNVKRISRLQ